jgi:hypothetical protein
MGDDQQEWVTAGKTGQVNRSLPEHIDPKVLPQQEGKVLTLSLPDVDGGDPAGQIVMP